MSTRHVRRLKDWIYPPQKIFSVENKVTLVTGAASGLGQAIALGFNALGARVVLADKDVEGMQATAAEMTGDYQIVEMDVTEIESIKNGIKQIMNKYETIDVSFNIPGINAAAF